MKADLKDLIRLQNMEEFGFGPAAMKKIKKCAVCGRIASAANQYCRECGNVLPTVTFYDFYKTLHRVCPACDAVPPDDAEYCPVCGRALLKKKEENL